MKARYTYNYVMEDGMWKIQHHHSSVLPEEVAMGKPITEDEVRGLFNLWNNALATLDPKAVALRYAKKGVLLPTVSDTPRTNFAEIEDYFVNFLKLKPQGKILESYVTIGKNWCKGKEMNVHSSEEELVCSAVIHEYPFSFMTRNRRWNLRVHHECDWEESQGPLLLRLRL